MGFSPEDIATSRELTARLRLIRSDGIGPVSFKRLVEKHGDAQNVIAMLEAATRKGTAKTKLAELDDLAAELEQASRLNVRYFFLDFAEYPPLLADLNDAPPVVTYLGNKMCMTRPTIAVVGARNCSAGGVKLTQKICADLSAHGFTVISGMARGIDTAAHLASVNEGTIACLAGGIDVIYPSENEALYNDIINTGLVISEMPLGTKPQARHFPRRNRIISGLSSGLLVIEAARRSGSLITAGFAAEQNRDVFAVPGSPLDPRAQGCNQLIRDGAVLVQTAEDIISEYEAMPLLRAVQHDRGIRNNRADRHDHGPIHKDSPKKQMATANQNKRPAPISDIVSLLSSEPIHIDELVRLSGQPAEVLLMEFTEMEILGDVMRHAGGKYSRISMKNE